MLYRRLLKKSEQLYAKHGVSREENFSWTFFSDGAKWMHAMMEQLRGHEIDFPQRNFAFYGNLKYLLCVSAFVCSALLLFPMHPWLSPLSVVVFYLAEIQLLFLFPLLIDNTEKPMYDSLRMTFRAGEFRSLFTVIPIAVYMLLGLLNFKSPFRNWYIGALAILIWYEDEIRTGN